MLKKGDFKAKFFIYLLVMLVVGIILVISQGQLGLPGEGDVVECPQLSPPLQKEGCTYTPSYDDNRCIRGYDEKCITCPQWTPPAPDWCKDVRIVSGGVDENGCQLPPKCEPIKCSDLSVDECKKYEECELKYSRKGRRQFCRRRAFCTDSDGGKDYYTKGVGKGLFGDITGKGIIWGEDPNKNTVRRDDNMEYSIIYDFCNDAESSNYLTEAYCTKDNFLQIDSYQCPNGCIDGACLRKPECKTDADCPQINCITAPCPQYSCIDEKCVSVPCPDYAPPYCPNGNIISGGVDENGCPLPPKCEPIKCSDYSPEECLKYENCELVKKRKQKQKCVEKPKCPKKAPAVCPIYECIEGAISVQNPDTCCYECKPVCGNNICETGECKEDEKCAYPCPQDCKKETTPKLLFKGTLPTELAPHGSGNVYAPEVLFENGVYKMWYGGQGNDGHDRIHYAESNDGVNWIKKGVVLDNGASNHVNDPSIVKIDKPKLTWSSAGPIAGKHCVQIIESADPHTWDDNYLCSDKDYGFAWSSAGPISEMHCTQVIETADPDTWDDNYLCSRIDYGAKWSSAGPISGMDCIQIIESADPHTWDDNYLCFSDLYYMYYTDAESGEDDRIHLAISSDGLTWTKRGMVLDAGPWDWNKVRVGRPAVIYDSNTFKMWYDTPDFNAGKLYIGYATSNDGVTWTKNPTPTHALRGGAVDVKKWKGIYFMLLEGRNGISLSTSKDGISWADQGIWLKKDDSAFDKFGLVTPFLLILNDKPDTVYFGGASLEGWNGNAVGMIKLNGDELNKFVTGAICGNNICEEGEKETCPQDCQKPTCTDSDGGKDVFVKGTAKSNGNIATDYCFDELNVNEAVCLEDGTIGIYTYGCPNRCKDGACVKGPQEQTFRNAEWACADGYKESQGEPTSCKTVETWLTYAGKSCAGRCSGICPACISEPCPPCITTCGISYFSVATPCDSGGIVLPQGKLELSKIEFSIDKGGSEILTAGVTNTKNTPLYYKIRITPILGPTGEPFSIENPPWFQFAQNQVYTLAQGNSEKRDVRIAIPTNVLSGSYLLKFDIIDDDLPAPNNVYASKDFFVVVKG